MPWATVVEGTSRVSRRTPVDLACPWRGQGFPTETRNVGPSKFMGWRDDPSCGTSEPPRAPSRDGRGAAARVTAEFSGRPWRTGRRGWPGPVRISGGEGADRCLRIGGPAEAWGRQSALCGHDGGVRTGTAWRLEARETVSPGGGKTRVNARQQAVGGGQRLSTRGQTLLLGPAGLFQRDGAGLREGEEPCSRSEGRADSRGPL